MDDAILEPLKAYKTQLEKQFSSNTDAMFDDLVKRSGLDVAKNRAAAKAYRAELAAAKKLDDKLSSNKALSGFLIFLTVAGFIAAVVGIFLLVQQQVLAGGLCVGLGLAAAATSLGVILGALKPKIKRLEEEKSKHMAKANARLDECNRQMAPLNALFDTNMTKRLIEKTLPIIQLDDNFGMRRYDYLSGKYGFPVDAPNNRSTIGILTGEILEVMFFQMLMLRYI